MLGKFKERIRQFGTSIVYDGILKYMNERDPLPLQGAPRHSTKAHNLSKPQYSNVLTSPLFGALYPQVVNSSQRREYYKTKWGLMDYHIDFINYVSTLAELKAKNVLEIGGSNMPKELVISECGANKYVCIDKTWNYGQSDEHIKQIPHFRFNDISLREALKDNDYVIFDEYGEDIPDGFAESFDICISNAAVEHIANLPIVLQKIHRCLKEGGLLIAMGSPIWSSPDGIHEWINDTYTRTELHHNNWPKELEYCHLLMNYQEIFCALEEKYGIDFAMRYSHQVKNSAPRISLSKFFFEDYQFIMQKSPFKRKSVVPQYYTESDEAVIVKLQSLYPGYKQFNAGGVVIMAEK